jgi:lipoyl(octanoyl) transferase
MQYNVIYEDVGLKDYKATWDYQEVIFSRLVNLKRDKASIPEGSADLPGHLIFVEHPHVYTLGKSGSENNLLLNYIQLQAKEAAFYRIDRGGDITYHGPGQIVGYPIFDLERIGISLKEYIYRLEESVIATLSSFGIDAGRLDGATGVWIEPQTPGKARKICAIGVRASRYVTMHGFAFNVNTNLEYFNYINPCGFTDKGVTSMNKELGEVQDIEIIKSDLKQNLCRIFDLNWVNYK